MKNQYVKQDVHSFARDIESYFEELCMEESTGVADILRQIQFYSLNGEDVPPGINPVHFQIIVLKYLALRLVDKQELIKEQITTPCRN